MEEVLPPWASLATWVGLVIFVVLSIVKRWLIPRSHHNEVVEQLEARLDDRDALIAELRAANVALDARNDLLSDQIRELVGLGHSTAEVVTATVVQALPAARGGSNSADQGSAPATPSSGTQTRLDKASRRRSGRR